MAPLQRVFGTLISATLLALPATGALNRWSAIGPGGGQIDALAQDPSASRTLYAGTSGGGLFKTIDGGDSWTRLNGLPSTDVSTVAAIEVDPLQPSTVYVAIESSGVYKSVDGGASFTLANTGMPTSQSFIDLAVDPLTAGRVYVSSRESLHESANGGASWTEAAAGLESALHLGELAIDPSAPERLWLATESGLYRSNDGGTSWQHVASGLPGDDEVRTVGAFAGSPENADASGTTTVMVGIDSQAWAAVLPPGAIDAPASFSKFSTDLVDLPAVASAPRVASAAARPFQELFRRLFQRTFPFAYLDWLPESVAPRVELAATRARPQVFVAGTDFGVIYAVGRGPWKRLGGGLTGGLQHPVNEIAGTDAAPGTLWAGTHGGGVVRFDEQAAVFSRANQGLHASQVLSLASDPLAGPILYAGLQLDGVHKSLDGGRSWTRLLGGLPGEESVYALVVDPGNGATVYAGTASKVWKSTNGGATWIQASQGIAATCAFALAIDPSSPATLYTGTCGGGGLYKTTNGGASWSPANQGLTDDYVQSLAIDPKSPTTLYAGTYHDGVFRSTDGAASWSPVNNDPTARLATYIGALAVDPFVSSALAAPDGRGPYRTTNGGTTWNPANGGLGDTATVRDFAHHPAAQGTVYAASGFAQFGATPNPGVFRSTNGGSSWSVLTAPGLGHTALEALAIDRQRPENLYAGTNGGGAFRLSSGSGGPCVASGTVLCLQGNRFRVEVDWRVPASGQSGKGNAGALTADTGTFWFFDAANVELVLKLLDARVINDHFWVFYGALSDVQFTLTVTDTQTGNIRTYFNPSGTQASLGDTAAFPGTGTFVTAPADRGLLSGIDSVRLEQTWPAAETRSRAAARAACAPGGTRLCLAANRFAVEVSWRAVNTGQGGAGNAVPLTSDTGTFWFFDAANVELVLKVLDARVINGHFWVFYGALSDVEYTITVTDTETGQRKTYFNPQGTQASRSDVTAF